MFSAGKSKLEIQNNISSFVHLALDVDRAIHHVDNVLCNRHAKTRSLDARDRRRIHTGKRIINLRQEIFAHANARVLDAELVNAIAIFVRFLLFHREPDGATRRRVLDSV